MRIQFFFRTLSAVSILSAISVFVAIAALGCQTKPSQSDQNPDVGSQMNSYVKQGRYEDAIQVGLQSLKNAPSDELIYEGIATVYLLRARKEPDQAEQWVSKAVSSTDKALSLNSKDSDVAGVHLLQDAQSFEVAGDLSSAQRCAYYERAKKILESRVPLLQGDHITLEGRAFPLAPLRKENDRKLEEVRVKSVAANCR
jgi:tetratricopeptide (TPR) repeat protein